jgi:hypothetical protein
MSTKYPELFDDLAREFRREDVRTLSKGGKSFEYVTASTVQNRLDCVLGPENWWNTVEWAPTGKSLLYSLTIRLPDGSTITKVDAGAPANMPDEGDDDKSAVSDGLKRVGAMFGIGRSFRGCGQVLFGPEPTGDAFEDQGEHSPPSQAVASQTNGQSTAEPPEPRNGVELLSWLKRQEESTGVKLLTPIIKWAESQRWPAHFGDWNPDKVALTYRKAKAKLKKEGARR